MTKITGETGETRRDGDGGSGLHAAAEKTQHPAASGALPIYVDKRIQEELELLGVRGGKEVKEGALDEKVDKMDEMGGKGKINGEMMFWEKTRKRGCGEGGKDMDDEHENENENKDKDKDEGIVMGKGKGLMGWINWDKWGISFVLVLFNTLLFLPLAYIIARFIVPTPYQWMGFILSHHILLALGYEICMNIRDQMNTLAIEEQEEKQELQKWDEVCEKLNEVLKESRKNRRVMEDVEDGVLMGEIWDRPEKEGFEGGGWTAIHDKVREMEGARRNGWKIDEGLLLAVRAMSFDLGGQSHVLHSRIEGRWRGKSWRELCEARGVLEDY